MFLPTECLVSVVLLLDFLCCWLKICMCSSWCEVVGAWSFLDVIWHLRMFSAFTGQHMCTLSQQEAVEARAKGLMDDGWETST